MPPPHRDMDATARPAIGDPLLYATIRSLELWQYALVPALSAMVDKMIETGDLSIETADALDDLGQICQRLGAEIIEERHRRGMPMPDGPDD